MKRILFLCLMCLLCLSTLAYADDQLDNSDGMPSSNAEITTPPFMDRLPSSLPSNNNATSQNQAIPEQSIQAMPNSQNQVSSGQIPSTRANSQQQAMPGQVYPANLSTLPGSKTGTQTRPNIIKDDKLKSGKESAVKDGKEKDGKDELGVEKQGAAELKKAEPPMISATEKALNDDHALLEDIRPQFSREKKIVQFGYSFFKSGASGFAPLMDVPVGPDYVLGVGDRIILTVWGSIDGNYELEVNRNGEIALPKVGTVKVAGVPYGQLQQVVRTNMAKVFKDFHLNVNMGKLRLMKVYLVGEVKSPGDYNLSSLSTLLNALSAAGGPTKNGSLRAIQIKRGGALAEVVDLYDFFLKGDKSRDIRLQAGDTIYIPTIGPVAGITGNVRRPAIYELKDEKSLKDLLSLADGINPGGYLQRVQISRVDAHDRKVVTDFNIDPAASGKTLEELTSAVSLHDLDMVTVLPIDSTLRNYVKLEGYVLRPGDYAITPGMRISSLLTKDNLLPEYYSASGQITRRYPPDLHPEVMFFNVGKAIARDPVYDLPLQEFDKIQLFARWEMEDIPKVRVNGDVQKPGEYRLFQNMTVRDLLLQAGNIKQTAYLKNAEITRIKKTGESVASFPININLEEALQGMPKDNLTLQPFDELTVRKIPNWAEKTERYITLKGEFIFPGVYPIFKGETLSSVIQRAGGFTDKAYLPGAKFTREQLKEMQQKRMDEITTRAELDLTKKQSELASTAASKEELEATKAALEGMLRTLAILRNAKAEGRMVIRLAPEEQLKNSEYNFEVVGGDVLDVPNDPKVVSVMGQVYNPTSFIHLAAGDVEDYLAKAGGVTREAEKDDIYIIKADGSVVSRQVSSKGIFGFGGFMAKPLESGDTIVVPQRLEKVAWMRELKDIAFIFGQLALTAGVLVAAGL